MLESRKPVRVSVDIMFPVQMELKLVVAALVSKMHMRPNPERMKATNVAELIEGVRSQVSLKHDGGVHLCLTPRVPNPDARIAAKWRSASAQLSQDVNEL